VCLDETSKQLIVETRTPIPAKPGQPERHDYEYERNGVANLFMMFAPLEGWRHVKVTDRHTAIDYAHVLRELSDVHFPDAAKIVLMQDNLNTHKPASLYERSMKPSRPPKRVGSSSASNGITRPSTAAGSTWPNPNSACSRRNVWIAALTTKKSSPTKSAHGRTTATSTTPKQTGNSQPPTPASS
jgi:DDE superfamily endonuclease